MTYEELQETIKKFEEEGRFNEHLNPVDQSNVIKVDERFPYIHKGFWKSIAYFLHRVFIVTPFAFHKRHHEFNLRVEGRENIKGIHNAVVTSNHVDIFDCLANHYALRPRKVYTVTASFNNFHGFLGTMMRADRILPLAETMEGMRKFLGAVKEVTHKKNCFLLIYPEQSLWWHYNKARPLKDGAYKFALDNNVPIIPMWTSLKKNGKHFKNGYPKDDFTIVIGKAIYPKADLSRSENLLYLRDENYKFNLAQSQIKHDR